MFDTIRLGIPLTEEKFNKLQTRAFGSGEWVHAKFNPVILNATDDPMQAIFMRRIPDDEKINIGSWEKTIHWSIPGSYEAGLCKATVEVSLPKLFYAGDNIRLLYEMMPALLLLKKTLEKAWKIQLDDPLVWRVLRLDVCYAWKVPSQKLAQQILDSCKQLNFPWKKPTIYEESIYFPGSEYTVKLYLKLPEFRKHDRKGLLKLAKKLEPASEANQLRNYVDYLESFADGVIRFEVELRRDWLQKNDIRVVADVLRPEIKIQLDSGLEQPELGDLSDWAAIGYVSVYHIFMTGSDLSIPELIESAENGQRFEAPARNAMPNAFIEFETKILKDILNQYSGAMILNNQLEAWIEEHGFPYQHPGGGYIVNKVDRLESILQSMWAKFIGGQYSMSDKEKVLAILQDKYSRPKATRLFGFWQFVADFGQKRAKDDYGKDSYYRCLKGLEEAGVSIAFGKVVDVDHEFLSKFDFRIPSMFAVNPKNSSVTSNDKLFQHPVIPNLRI